jgi:hypothetical protein
MNSRKHIFILVMLLGVATATCLAQTWDATKDFAASNPNGAWSYGYGNTGSTFTPYTIYNPDCGIIVHGIVCWTAEEYGNAPNVAYNTTGGWLDDAGALAPPNALNVHPAPDWEPADTIVQWTAPATGTYRISGFFEILNSVAPTGIIGLVYRNETLLFRAEILGPPAQYPDQIGGRANFYFPQVSLNAGDVISFGVNYDGTFYYDTTGFNATIITPPNAPPCALCTQ